MSFFLFFNPCIWTSYTSVGEFHVLVLGHLSQISVITCIPCKRLLMGIALEEISLCF